MKRRNSYGKWNVKEKRKNKKKKALMNIHILNKLLIKVKLSLLINNHMKNC